MDPEGTRIRMDIGIIGAGNVGSALGTAWIRAGHRVRFGVKDPSDPDVATLIARLGPRASAHHNSEVAAASSVIVLATPWGATQAALQSCGNLAGKTVIDCTNPLLPGLAGLEVGHSTSGAEQIETWAAGASVFKCFNQTGAENMADQTGYSHPPVMFVAGDDAARKVVVLTLARDVGLEAVDAGPLTIARLLEPYAMLWIHLAFKMGAGRHFALAMLKRGQA
jgi:hypothetical protein